MKLIDSKGSKMTYQLPPVIFCKFKKVLLTENIKYLPTAIIFKVNFLFLPPIILPPKQVSKASVGQVSATVDVKLTVNSNTCS